MVRRGSAEHHVRRAVCRQRRVIQKNVTLADKTCLLAGFGDNQTRRSVLQHHAEAFVRVTGIQR
ncbi:hypothetical protein D3C81_851120 [compost metagenome]